MKPGALNPEQPTQVFAKAGLAPEESDAFNWRRLAAKTTAVGTLVMGAAFGYWNYFDRSEEYVKYPSSGDQPAQEDGVLTIGGYNLHGQGARLSDQIWRLMNDKQYRLDVLAVQEITSDDAAILHEEFPKLNIIYKLADARRKRDQGGQGNALITWETPTNIRAKTIDGNGFLDTVLESATGFGQDVANADTEIPNTKGGFQEKRSLIAATIKLHIAGQVIPIRIATGHIIGSGFTETHDRQLKQIMDFAADNADKGMPFFAEADFNDGCEQIITAAAQKGLISPETMPTLVNSNSTVDHFVYNPGNEFGLADTKVVKMKGSDHWPVIATWSLKGSTPTGKKHLSACR